MYVFSNVPVVEGVKPTATPPTVVVPPPRFVVTGEPVVVTAAWLAVRRDVRGSSPGPRNRVKPVPGALASISTTTF